MQPTIERVEILSGAKFKQTNSPIDRDKSVGTIDEACFSALNEAIFYFFVGAILAVALYIMAFREIHPEFTRFAHGDSKPWSATGRDFIPISVGDFQIAGDVAIINGFHNDEAILGLPKAFDAEDYPFIALEIEGVTRFSRLKILWRQASDLSTIHSMSVTVREGVASKISMVNQAENYRGKIADIALLIYDGPELGVVNNQDKPIFLRKISFEPLSYHRVAEQILDSWTNPPLWSGRSNNLVRGAAVDGILQPNLWVNMAIGLALMSALAGRKVLARVANRRLRTTMLMVALGICVVGSGVNDIFRWAWRADQMVDAQERYSGRPRAEQIRLNALRCSRFPETCYDSMLPYL